MVGSWPVAADPEGSPMSKGPAAITPRLCGEAASISRCKAAFEEEWCFAHLSFHGLSATEYYQSLQNMACKAILRNVAISEQRNVYISAH